MHIRLFIVHYANSIFMQNVDSNVQINDNDPEIEDEAVERNRKRPRTNVRKPIFSTITYILTSVAYSKLLNSNVK